MQKIITVLSLSMLFTAYTIGSNAQTLVEYSADSMRIVHAEFDPNNPKTPTAKELFYSFLGLSTDNTFEVFDESPITADLYNYSYMQYYKGIEIENSSMCLHFKNGKLMRFLGYYLPVSNFDTSSVISDRLRRFVIGAQDRFINIIYLLRKITEL